MMPQTLPFGLLLVALVSTPSPRALAGGSTTAANESGGKQPPEDDSKRGERPAPKKEEDPSECVSHTEQARYVAGYDHLVHVKNGCTKSVACEVSTNVNPKKQTVTVSSGKTETVLTFRGSPASEFKAVVKCHFDADAR